MAGNVAVIDPTIPDGATQVTASSGNVAAATATATLAAVANKTAYLTGFIITSAGSTAAAVVNATVTGVIGGTMTFTYTSIAGATLANPALVISFPVPVAASAINQAIAVSLPALAGSTNAAVVATGYYK